MGSRARDLYTAVRQPQKPEGPAEYSRKQDPDRLVQAWFSLMGRSQRRKKPTQERFEAVGHRAVRIGGKPCGPLLRGS